MKPTDPRFTVYCRMTCLGGSERGLCGGPRPDACELAGDPGYAAARGAAQDRMLRAVPFLRARFGLGADRGREAVVIPLRRG